MSQKATKQYSQDSRKGSKRSVSRQNSKNDTHIELDSENESQDEFQLDTAFKGPWCCLSCEEDIEKDKSAIECSKCKGWCHKECTDLTSKEYAMLEHGNASILWHCSRCLKNGKNIQDKDRLEKKLDMVLSVVCGLDSRLKSLETLYSGSSIEEIIEEKVNKKVNEALAQLQAKDSNNDEVLEELTERDKRKNNLILVNMIESTEITPEDRRNEDLRKVREIIKKIVDVKDDEILNPIRLGKLDIGSGRKPRLLKVTIKTQDTKTKILKSAYKINQGINPGNRIYINHDCTQKEREDFKKLRIEMKEREKRGEKDLVIRGNRIVKRRLRTDAGDCRDSTKDSVPQAINAGDTVPKN